MMADNIEHVISYWLLYREISLAGARRLRGAQPLDAVLALRGLFRRHGRPLRLPQSHSGRADHVHGRVGGVGVSVLDRYHRTLACLRSSRHPWHGGSTVGTGQPIAHSRHRRPRAIAERHSAQLDEPATGSSFRAGGGRRHDADLQSVGGIDGEHADLPAADPLAARVPYTGHSREGAAPARRAIGWRDAFQIVREISGNRPIITMVALGGCVSFFVGTAFQATMPEFAHDLGTEKADFAYSALLAANAAGAVVGGFYSKAGLVAAKGQNRVHQRHTMVRRHRLFALSTTITYR